MSTVEGGTDVAQFTKVLLQRTDQFFQNRGISRRGNRVMTAKVVLALSYWAASYIYLCIAALEPLAFLLAYVAHGLGHVFIVLNIGHDANHHAIAPAGDAAVLEELERMSRSSRRCCCSARTSSSRTAASPAGAIA